MSSASAAISRIRHNFLIATICVVWVTAMGSAPCGQAWTVPHHSAPTDMAADEKVGSDHPCAPVLLLKPKPDWPKAIRRKKGESYKRDPVIGFGISETGEVINARVVRSSGVGDIDAWVLKEIQKWKYRPAPSCGVRKSEISVTIDFDID